MSEDANKPLERMKWSDAPGVIFLWGLLIVVAIQFLTRNLLGSSPGWTEEGARYLLVLVTFFGSVSVVREGRK